MYFEAEVNKKKFGLTIREDRTNWRIGIHDDESKEWEYHNISKTQYKKLEQTISFIFNNSSYLVDVMGNDTEFNVYTRGSFRKINIYNDEMLLHKSLKDGGSLGGSNNLTSGMPGKIVSVMVKPGQEVAEGDPLLVMEAMKMENEMRASHDVVIDKVFFNPGDTVDTGAVLISFK